VAAAGKAMNSTDQEAIVAALLDPAMYGDSVDRVEKIETHISYLLLAGTHVYKIKKAVDLGFLDFSTLERRGFYCLEELRLNRRLAPALYLEVVPITGSYERPRLGGPGTPIEYAVKMRRFAQDDLFDAMLAHDLLAPNQIDRLAEKIANFHMTTAAAADDPYGLPSAVRAPVLENFTQIRQTSAAASSPSDLDELEKWTTSEYDRLESTFRARKAGGFVRECHGDFHLGNVALVHGEVTAFDCLEFSANLRWIDVQSEIAFMVMDLQARNRTGLAQRFLNRYLEFTGDYAGLEVLRFYLVYRAMVRAKVHALRGEQPHVDAQQRAVAVAKHRNYLDLAKRLTRPQRPAIVITHGLSGSGKTTHTEKLLEILPAIRIRSDIERKRLKGLSALARSGSPVSEGLYTPGATELTYARLAELAATVVRAGFIVIVDATFLECARRGDFHRLADSHDVVFMIVEFVTPEAVLRSRVAERQQQGTDASEADLTVLEHQLRAVEPLGPNERIFAVTIDATRAPSDVSWASIDRRLKAPTR
jgi:aminoglycoside phosphotransferase family enzyme/predicted kinase